MSGEPPRLKLARSIPKTCDQCSKGFMAVRNVERFCSAPCSKKWWNKNYKRKGMA